MATSIEFGIVAALERELRPLLRNCQRIRSTPDFAFYEFGNAVVVCGGIGKAAAGRAAQALVEAYRPATLVSAGFAGALRCESKIGDLFLPAEILDVQTGQEYLTKAGQGTLATVERIADQAEKAKLAEKGALAADMEAAAVARVAQHHAVDFFAVKAISDEEDFPMPRMDEFITAGGRFRPAHFFVHVLARPSMWLTVKRLASNSARAAKVLSAALDTLLREGTILKSQFGAIVRADA